jgi:hypothetical protein
VGHQIFMNFTSDFTASALLCVIRGEIPQLHNACLAATANSLVKFTNIPLIFFKNLILPVCLVSGDRFQVSAPLFIIPDT